MKIPRVVIAGTTSGVGKTSITIGLMYGLMKQGFKVQGFKVGPDYIDTSYHTAITKRESRNLDAWLMNDNVIKSFVDASIDADISIIEGVMGLFDGISGKNDFASTAHIARLLNAPIILVLDASKTARSIAAITYGFMRFDPRLDIAGIIINKIASEKHEMYCLDALKGLNVRVVGVIRRNDDIKLEERHLGLIPAQDNKIMRKAMDVAEYIANQLNIDKIKKIAFNAKDLDVKIRKRENNIKKVSIGVALDNSFNFYYADNLQRLKEYGAEIIPFSPIHNNTLPDVNGLYIGGGFPEILADALSNNTQMLNAIRKAGYDGMPIYAECGGLMYLSKYITDFESRKYNMVGLLDLEVIMSKKLTLNYTSAITVRDSIILERGKKIKGHEFHHSIINNIPKDLKFVYELKRGKGIDGKIDGIISNNVLASYMHIYFNDKMVKRFITHCISNDYKYNN